MGVIHQLGKTSSRHCPGLERIRANARKQGPTHHHKNQSVQFKSLLAGREHHMDQPHLPESHGAAPLHSIPTLCKSHRSQPQEGLGWDSSMLPYIVPINFHKMHLGFRMETGDKQGRLGQGVLCSFILSPSSSQCMPKMPPGCLEREQQRTSLSLENAEPPKFT